VHDAVQAFRYLNLVAFTALGAIAVVYWDRHRERAAMWAATSFGSLALLELLSFVPNHPHNLAERAVGRVVVVLLVLFPYLLFRFTTSFRTAGRWAVNALLALAGALVVWTLALPRLPQPGEPRPAWLVAYLVAFTVYWALLSLASAGRLWRAGAAQPTVARRRTRLLSIGSAMLAVALVLAALTNNTHSRLALGAQCLASASVLAFLLVFEPPRLLRLWWRAPEQIHLQEAIAGLLAFAASQEEMAERVLEPAAQIVGARGIAIRNADGRVIASWDMSEEPWPERWPSAEVVELEVSGGSLVVWTSPYAPFFGDEELSLLRTLGDLTGLALERVRSYQTEHEARLALERANELQASFIALAAHELRTPMTTIHGFVTTLYHLAERLDETQRQTVREALLQQTERMARLIEQLLDLSRLDAAAIRIRPEPLRVREHVQEIVAAATPDGASVEVDVDDDAVAVLDRNALERIVSNLVTNAFRYGEPPVIIRAVRNDRHFRLSVEDRGRGVGPEFVPRLFDRFTRSDASLGVPGGSGLGLAIARSYARAHGGDLLYEDATPHGARFRLVLPSPVTQPEVVASSTQATRYSFR
jgi:signal transduction histidine kinase